jgi:hypothetical protein
MKKFFYTSMALVMTMSTVFKVVNRLKTLTKHKRNRIGAAGGAIMGYFRYTVGKGNGAIGVLGGVRWVAVVLLVIKWTNKQTN